MDLFEHSASKDRDAALSAVDRREWREEAVSYVKELPSGWVGTGEDLRYWITSLMRAPHHHNAWGGFTMGLIKSGMLEKTGRHFSMHGPKSHGRSTPEYRRA